MIKKHIKKILANKSIQNTLADYKNNPAKLATRDGFGTGLIEATKKNNNIYGLSADLTSSLKMSPFAKQYPNNFVQVGVEEQNLIGVAAGLALAGKIPFAASYASFNPGRNWDQIRISVCYSNLNVKIVGGHAGLTTGQDGATHQALEDIAITRVLPNMTVIVPCDAQEAHKATLALAQTYGPGYLRLGREKITDITTIKTPFEIGKAITLRKGSDITIFACGEMVCESMLAADELAKENIFATIINLHTIKPIDKKAIIKAAKKTRAIVSVENHQITGGMGSAIIEVLAKEVGKSLSGFPAFSMVAIQDTFGESGTAQNLFKKYKIDKKSIIDSVYNTLEKKRKLPNAKI